MADAETETHPGAVTFLPFVRGEGKPVEELGAAETPYKYIFIVRILDINPKAFQAEVLRLPAAANMTLGDLTPNHLVQAITNGTVVNWADLEDLDLRLTSKEASLIIFHLVDLTATFDPDPNAVPAPDPSNGAASVILKGDQQPTMIRNARWITGITNKKSICAILLAHDPAIEKYQYGLRVLVTSANGTVSMLEIDPKIENDGEGGMIPVGG